MWHSGGRLILTGVTFLRNSAIIRSTCANSPESQVRERETVCVCVGGREGGKEMVQDRM